MQQRSRGPERERSYEFSQAPFSGVGSGVRHLKCEGSIRCEHSKKLRDVTDGRLGLEMLQRYVRIDKREGSGRIRNKVVSFVDGPTDIVVISIAINGRVDHGRRYVYAVALFKALRERARKPSDSAAEIQRSFADRVDAGIGHEFE